MDPLFSLPTEIWRDQILILLDLLDIVRASNAFLNKDIQNKFKSVLDGATLRKSLCVEPDKVEKLNWCLSKNLLSTSVLVMGDLDPQTKSIMPKFVTRVTDLTVSSSSIKCFDPGWCTRLVQLHVHVCFIISLGCLSLCPCLTTLELHSCEQLSTESLCESLSGCHQLENCAIKSCTQIIPFILKNHPRLAFLEFFGRPDHLYDVANVLNVPAGTIFYSVRTVVASTFTSVCSMGMRRLGQMFPQLQKLCLENDSGSMVSDDDVDFLCRSCPHIVDMSLRGFTQLTSQALQSVAQHLPLIEQLSVFATRRIRDEGVIAVARGCARLNKLHIYHCDYITDTSVQQVWLHCTLLEDLCLKWCLQITDAAFNSCVNTTVRKLNVCDTSVNCSFVQQAPNLCTLHCDSPYINSAFVNSLAAQPSIIQHLWMNYSNLGASDLTLLSAHLPEARTVSLTDSNATDDVVRSFVANCPHLQWLEVMYSAAVAKAVAKELDALYPTRKFKIYV